MGDFPDQIGQQEVSAFLARHVLQHGHLRRIPELFPDIDFPGREEPELVIAEKGGEALAIRQPEKILDSSPEGVLPDLFAFRPGAHVDGWQIGTPPCLNLVFRDADALQHHVHFLVVGHGNIDQA